MRGFLDPISLGFALSILGTVTALSLDTDSQANQDEMKAQVVIEEAVVLTQVD